MSATSTAAVASPASFGAKMLEMRDNEETMNVGKKWTVEEDIKLAQEIAENKTYQEIAMEHKRTVNSIELRVVSHIIFPKIRDDLEKGIDIDTLQLINHINKTKIKSEPSQKLASKPKQPPSQKEYLPTNKDILDYLKKLDSKMDEINSKLDNLEYLR